MSKVRGASVQPGALLNEVFDLFLVFDNMVNLAPTIQDGGFVALHCLSLMLFLCHLSHYPGGREQAQGMSASANLVSAA